MSGFSACAAQPYVNPAAGSHPSQVAPCYVLPCDPYLDPLRAENEHIDASKLKGRSFVATLGTSRNDVVKHCWTFGSDGKMRNGTRRPYAWSGDYLDDLRTSFQAIGEGNAGEGSFFTGKLVGKELLEVIGFASRSDSTRTSYGFAQEVKSCNGQ